MKALDRLRKKVEIATNGYEENLRREWYDLLDELEGAMKKDTPKAAQVQVNVDEAKVRLLEHEPITILNVMAFPDSESFGLALMTGDAVQVCSTGKKAAGRIVDVKLIADKKKENVVHARASIFLPGDFSNYVGLLVILKPRQTRFEFEAPKAKKKGETK